MAAPRLKKRERWGWAAAPPDTAARLLPAQGFPGRSWQFGWRLIGGWPVSLLAGVSGRISLLGGMWT